MNNTKLDNAKDLDVAMPIYNLIEYSDNYLKTSESLQKYYIDEPHNSLTNFESCKSKTKITGNTLADDDTKNIEIVVPLKNLRNFWGSLEMPLINCVINLNLTWSSTCVITNSTGPETFTIIYKNNFMFQQ